MLSHHDQILQQTCPTIMVPRFSELEPLATSGHRFLVASDGLWMEVRRPWLHAMLPVALQHGVAMPYGTVRPRINFLCGAVPRTLLHQFSPEAVRNMPNECGAWIVWSEHTGEFRYQSLTATSSGIGHLNIDRPALEEGEHLVVDMHSHGELPAFFSSTDDRDDAGEVKLSFVLGSLGSEDVSSKIRLCLNGLFVEAADLLENSNLTFG